MPTIAGWFVVRRYRWTLTWPGRLILLLCIALLAAFAVRNIYGFLSPDSPVGGKILVVEAWIPRYALREAVDVFEKGGYEKVIAAGTIDMDEDSPKEFFASGRLVEMGIPPDRIVDTTYPGVERDRTFHAALSVRAWLEAHGYPKTSIDVVTLGVHARRTRLLYQHAVGAGIPVGVVTLTERSFDSEHWWRSSQGTRRIIDETIAYLYARLLFVPLRELDNFGNGAGGRN